MGSTYYYYYELDGSIETHDQSLPSTTICPYLPGQSVNTLVVPTEKTLRDRSASMSSLRQSDWTTMRPSDRFVAPRAAPSPSPSPVPQTVAQRLATALPRPGSSYGDLHRESKGFNNILRHKASSRSLSPAPSWRRFFRGFRERSNSDRDRSAEDLDRSRASRPSQPRSVSYSISAQQQLQDVQPQIHAPIPKAAAPFDYNTYVDVDPYPRSDSRQTTRSRDISPESLRRFLVEDVVPRGGSSLSTARPLTTSEYTQPQVLVTPAAADATPVLLHAMTMPMSRPVSSRSARSFTLPTSMSPLAAAPVLTATDSFGSMGDKEKTEGRKSVDFDDDDFDDNFASPTIPDTPAAFTTFLSPPPAASKRVPAPLDAANLSTATYKLSGTFHSPIFAKAERFGEELPGLTTAESVEVSPLEDEWRVDVEGSMSSLSTLDGEEDEVMGGIEFEGGLYLGVEGGKRHREMEWVADVVRARAL